MSSGLLTADPHASLEGLQLIAYVLLSSLWSLKSMRNSVRKKSMLSQSPADLVNEHQLVFLRAG